MDAVRQIYESLPNVITVPAELRRRRVEVIILPLDENGDAPKPLSREERDRALETLMRHAGSVQGGDRRAGDNDRIDADLASEYGKDV